MMMFLVGVVLLEVGIIFWLVRRRKKQQKEVALPPYQPRPNTLSGMVAGSGRPPVGLAKESTSVIRPGTRVTHPKRVVREGSSGYNVSQTYFFADPVSTVQYQSDDDTRRSSMFDGGSSGGGGASSSWDSGSSDSGSSCDSGGGDSGGGGGCD
jgi:uncharacterized membrane protein YgcG